MQTDEKLEKRIAYERMLAGISGLCYESPLDGVFQLTNVPRPGS